MANPPVKGFSAGGVRAAVWKREIEREGVTRELFSVTVEKNYKDKDGNWQKTGFLSTEDIPKAKLLLDEAYRFIVLKGEQQPATPRQQPGDSSASNDDNIPW